MQFKYREAVMILKNYLAEVVGHTEKNQAKAQLTSWFREPLLNSDNKNCIGFKY